MTSDRARPAWLTAAEIEEARVTHLFDPYIVAGALNLIVGYPGVGKSTWTMDVSARVSRGAETPDSRGRFDPRDVLIVSAEDSPGIVRMRLEAASADMHRVRIRDMATLGKNWVDDIASDIQFFGATLVVVDPLMAVVRGDPFKDHEIRERFLTPLSAAATETGAAILIVTHPTKSFSPDLIRQAGGSIGIVGAVRSAMYFGRDPADQRRVVIAHFKANYSKCGPSLDFTIADGGTLVPGEIRPEFYMGRGLVEQPQGQAKPPARSATSSLRGMAAEAARSYVKQMGGYAPGPDVRRYVYEATGYEVPESGSQSTRFRQLAGLDVAFVGKAGRGPGRAFSLWKLPVELEEEDTKQDNINT